MWLYDFVKYVWEKVNSGFVLSKKKKKEKKRRKRKDKTVNGGHTVDHWPTDNNAYQYK